MKLHGLVNYQKWLRLVAVLCTVGLFVASLWPRISRHYQSGEKGLGIAPEEGDNFKAANLPAVYRLQNGKKHKYLSDTSFFNHPENEPFGTPYEEGGILICDVAVVEAIPQGDYMPLMPGDVPKEYQEKRFWEEFWVAFFRKDKATHFFSYFLWSLLFILALPPRWWANHVFVWLTLLVGSMIGLSAEYVQGAFVPGRDMEALDMLFNFLGLLTGVGGCWYLFKK